METSQTESIEIVLNGERLQVQAGLSVLALLGSLEIDPERVAIELNREIVRRGEWESTAVPSAAAIEIVQFVGGG